MSTPTPAPRENDFTAGPARAGSRRSFTGSTGDAALDVRIAELAAGISGVAEPALLLEMLVTSVRIGRMEIEPGEFKLFNRALKEMRHAEEVFKPWRNTRKVAVFGSARTAPEESEYQAAVEFSRRMREQGFMTITGAGPGIMAAGNEGAGRDHSFGLNIVLPFEAAANEFIAGDEKLVAFNYFFTRKLSFVKESDALVGFPGGFGTMDEVFESLTLIQTGKSSIYPIVLIDAKGGTYWRFWEQFINNHLLRLGLISEADLSLYKVTDDVDEAVAEIVRFYRVFHSYRYIGDQLVIRMRQPLAEGEPERLTSEFADLIKSGGMTQRDALEEEDDEPEMQALPRLVFRHRRRDYGRLRLLINAINQAALA
ncbi:MAG: TIGR00730 family Rossman fold protein [Akkermansiaceae bacterium]|nr:TIGR00730 family Rossman fold protein [Akkermansiaceae bacterium]MCF7733992.1 TIGR00730 family Rossman fold protein [Akkermansiaceae bacterium]